MMDEKTKRLLVNSGRGQEAYALRVEELVRERYSVSAELAILRQRETKAERARTLRDLQNSAIWLVTTNHGAGSPFDRQRRGLWNYRKIL